MPRRSCLSDSCIPARAAYPEESGSRYPFRIVTRKGVVQKDGALFALQYGAPVTTPILRYRRVEQAVNGIVTSNPDGRDLQVMRLLDIERGNWHTAARVAIALALALAFFGSAVRAAPAQVGQDGAPSGSALDDPFVRDRATLGLDHLYNMDFSEAARYFDEIDARYPKHPIGPFLHALNTWWKILLDLSDTSHDGVFYRAMDDVIDRADALLKRDRNDFDAYFFKGAALGFRGRLRSNRGDWFRAAMDGKRAMDYVLAVARKDPDNHDYVFGKGIYDYYASVIEDRYPFTKPVMIFFPSGDRERGLRELTRTAEHGTLIQTEAAYFLLQIYYLFEQDYEKSIYYSDWLRSRHPDNSFFHTFQGRVLARWGRWSDAETVFRDVLKRYYQKKPGYNAAAAEQAFYFLARGGMATRRFDQALTHLQNLEILTSRRPTDTYFKVWGILRQGMVYDAIGNRARAEQKYREVLRMKNWADAHDRAREYIATPYS